MSYLDLPRVHLFGSFFATPSTINNLDGNYDPATVLTPKNVLWNPRGQALWKMDVQARTVLRDDGTPAPAGDPLLGARLVSVPAPNDAKLVDLDPDMQFVSQVFGLTVQLTLADGRVAFTGSVDPCALGDLWFGRVANATRPGGNTYAGGAFQSVVRVTWKDTSTSPLLRALRDASPRALSIKWNVDAYSTDLNSPGFGFGRMAATLGPVSAGEPAHVVMGRRLEVPADAPTTPGGSPKTLLWFGVARLAGERLTLDLGNSVAADGRPGGPPVTFPGPITVSAVGAGGAPVVLGTVAFTGDAYESRAGIFDLPLTAAQAAAAAAAPLRVQAPVPADQPLLAGYTAVLAEAADGLYVNADLSFSRLDAGETEERTVYASRFGVPATTTVRVGVMQPAPDPAGGLTFDKSVTVKDGAGTLHLQGGSVGDARPFIDGQVYPLAPAGWSDWLAAPMVSALVFSDTFKTADPPTWDDVGPVLAAFARLYPGMRDIMDLSDYGTMRANAGRLQAVLSLPVAHPNYMPVTRDLSTLKRTALLKWIEAGCPPGAAATPPAAAPVPSAESAADGPAPAAHGRVGEPGPDAEKFPNDYHLY